MRSKGMSYLLLSVVLAIVPLACGNGLDITPGEYELAVINGPWFLDASALTGPEGYFVADGLGNIVDHSFFASVPSGSYTMTNGGSFTVGLNGAVGGVTALEGRMRSSTEGRVDKLNSLTVTGTDILKVPDVSVLSGTISGTLTQTCNQIDTSDKNICDTASYILNGLSVDAYGVANSGTITNTTDTFTINEAGAYAIGTSVIIFLHTSGSDTSHRPYDFIKITGTLSGGNAISGKYWLYSDLPGHVGDVTLSIL